MDKEELKRKNPQLYKVAMEGGTEAPYSGKYWKTSETGLYSCAVCGNPLFESGAKFETKLTGLMGWPSFEDAIPGSIETRQDDSLGMHRNEVVCKKCGSHLGHIFEDPPSSEAGKAETKTGKHYCINSVCLDLKKNEK